MTDNLHRTLRRQMSRVGIPPEEVTDPRYRALLSRVSAAYDEAEKQRYLHDRAFLLASTEMQTLYDRLEQASQSAAAVQRDRLRAVFDTAATGLIVVDAQGVVLDINQVAESVLAVAKDSIQDEPLERALMAANGLDHALTDLGYAITQGKNWRSPDTAVRTSSGATFSAALFYRAMSTGGGVLAIEDISERKQAQAELLWRANHDPLTGLFNRAALMEQIQRALQRARRYGHRIAVMFLDLDKFKRVNDTLGHAAGDALLVDCSQRISSVMREVDTVSRLGGDEFVLVCENLMTETEARLIANRLVDVIAKPFDIGADVAFVNASIGIALSDGHNTDPDQLLRDADVALYEAKEVAGSAIIVYREAMITRIQHTLDLERRIRRGLENDEFSVAYQPIFELPQRRFLGYEALARWTSGGAEIPPAEFIPVAQSAALLDEIGRRVMLQALRFLTSACPAGTLMFLNLAPSQIAADGFVTWFDSVLELTGADPHDLVLEVTEMADVTDYEIGPVLDQLRDRGARIALDDFGVGHSSLASLHNLPVDLIKVDRSFLSRAPRDHRAEEIAKMVCQLGQHLGIEVVAEGVETEEHLGILDDIGCNMGQGYLLGRPETASAAMSYLP
jgi:diguanylate cyclase (GGDEF)-like protein/PAS domain S-box-containing protein